LLLKPNGIQEHVLRNIGSQTVDLGLLSAGRKVGSDNEAFQKEFVYEIRNKREVDALLMEALAKGLQLGKLSQILKRSTRGNSTKLAEATVFGFVPKGDRGFLCVPSPTSTLRSTEFSRNTASPRLSPHSRAWARAVRMVRMGPADTSHLHLHLHLHRPERLSKGEHLAVKRLVTL
jgi:hypothetical protein